MKRAELWAIEGDGAASEGGATALAHLYAPHALGRNMVKPRRGERAGNHAHVVCKAPAPV